MRNRFPQCGPEHILAPYTPHHLGLSGQVFQHVSSMELHCLNIFCMYSLCSCCAMRTCTSLRHRKVCLHYQFLVLSSYALPLCDTLYPMSKCKKYSATLFPPQKHIGTLALTIQADVVYREPIYVLGHTVGTCSSKGNPYVLSMFNGASIRSMYTDHSTNFIMYRGCIVVCTTIFAIVWSVCTCPNKSICFKNAKMRTFGYISKLSISIYAYRKSPNIHTRWP